MYETPPNEEACVGGAKASAVSSAERGPGYRMGNLNDIQKVAKEAINQKFTLEPVSLKYPFPERPVRTLGLIKVDGEVFSSEKFSRVVFFRLKAPAYLSVYSIFLRPRMEYDLPVFSTEAIFTGNKRMVLTDIHRTGDADSYDDSALFDTLLNIKKRYPALIEKSVQQEGEIQNVFSKAACQVKITEELENDALSLFREYLTVFLDRVEKAEPLSGDVLNKAKGVFETYLKTVVDHDPGFKGYKMLFGKPGVTRALDVFFDR
jgi:hypothetical protein